MKVLVTGGRSFGRLQYVYATLDDLHKTYGFKLLIHGDCRSKTGALSADQLGHNWAKARGVQPCACEALWAYHGHSAGFRRNGAMLRLAPDIVVAFPGGNGTADMVHRAQSLDIPVISVGP